MTPQSFDHTAPALAAVARCQPAYVLRLAKAGLIEHILSTDGRRLFQRATAKQVQAIKKENLSRRGRWRSELN
jgi:hypothetical protein